MVANRQRRDVALELLRECRSVIDEMMGDSDLDYDDSAAMQVMKKLSRYLDKRDRERLIDVRARE